MNGLRMCVYLASVLYINVLSSFIRRLHYDGYCCGETFMIYTLSEPEAGEQERETETKGIT